ncbi:MAG: ABC transporter ATP-binding protein [Bacteroidota bacterium]
MTLHAHRLSKRYGATPVLALDDLHVASGERVALVGNNGAGKTTLLRLALDLIAPTTGHVTLDGLRVGGGDEAWKRRTGAFLDTGFLVDFLRPLEYFRLVAGSYGVAAPEADARLERFERFLGPALEGGLIRDLSLGNAAKVGIVGAMLPRPDLLILDEPFANLDPGARIALEGLLRDEGDRGATVLVSSHDLDHVVGVASRVLVLAEGRLVRDTPSTPDTRAELRAFFAAGGTAPEAVAA